MANEVVKLQSGLSREPQIATFAIAHRSTPERLAISSAIYTAGWRKFVPPPGGRNPLPSHFGTGRIRGETATERYQTESPGTRVPLLFSAFGPCFSPNLHPILRVPVRRLWK